MPRRPPFLVPLLLAPITLLLAARPVSAEIQPLAKPTPVAEGGGSLSCPVLGAGQGGYVVGWQVPGPFSDELVLRQRRFDSLGRPAGQAVTVGNTRRPPPVEFPKASACGSQALGLGPGGETLTFWVLRAFTGPFATPETRILVTPVGAAGTAAPPREVSGEERGLLPVSTAAAGQRDGRILAAWRGVGIPGGLFVRLFAPSGELLRGRSPVGDWTDPQVVALEGGFFLVAGETAAGGLAGRLVAAGGIPVGDPFPIHDGPAEVAPLVGGGFAAVWIAAASDVVFRLFDADGTPRGEPMTVARDPEPVPPAFITEPAGPTLMQPGEPGGGPGPLVVAWRERVLTADRSVVQTTWLRARAVTLDGSPVGPALRLEGDGDVVEFDLKLATAVPGTFLAAWESDPPCDALSCPAGRRTYVRPFVLTSSAAALGPRDRFRVSVTWRDFQGGSGVGVPEPFSDDTLAFWFFRPSNLELMIKVLDGRAVNGHFWVFGGALSNVGYTVTVVDSVTDRTWTYDNPPRNLASFADTTAFPDG